MVRDDDAGALELHIRVNEQNLAAIPEKCNIGTLRLPSDPSWPKIPLRRLTGNTDNVIRPPCMVTVTGTPGKNRNTVQSATHQHPKSGINNKYETSRYVPERLPGCTDPRFRRQVRQKQAEKPDELCNVNQTQMRKNISHKYQNEGVKREEVAGNIHTISVSTDSKTCTSKESGNGKVIQQHSTRNISENRNTLHRNDGCVSNRARDKENINNNNNLTIHKILSDQDICGNLNTGNNVGDARNYENTSNLNITGKSENAQEHKGDSRSSHALQHRSHSTLSIFEQKMLNEKVGTARISESCLRCSCSKANESGGKVLQEDVQITNEERHKSDENKTRLRHGKVCHISKRKTANPTNLSRKAKSFFRKRSRLATTDSDCTLMLPGPRRIKGKRYRYEKTHDRLKINQLSRRRNWINGTNSIQMKFHPSKRSRMNRRRLLAKLLDNPFEQLSSIPLKTQELLNKSYLEYYWRKLRHKIALAEPDTAREEDKRFTEPRNRANLPASRTLQQCSVLSCMINNTLDTPEKTFRNPTIAATINKSSSDSIANGSATRKKVCEGFDLSSMCMERTKRQEPSHASKRLLGLKAIVFLVVTVYVAIVFFPMMYDYLMFDEEHDDYDEDVNYIVLALEYIASSFEEAFDEIVQLVNTVFLHPVSFNREL